MPRSPRPRYAALALASCGALFSAFLLPAGPASALVLPPSQLEVGGSVDFSTSSPTCTEVGSEPDQTTTFTHGSVSDTATLDTTVTNTDAVSPDAGDHSHVSGHITATATQRKHLGSTTSYRLTGSGAVSVAKAEGDASQCDVTASMTAQAFVAMNQAKSGWMYVTRSQPKSIITEMEILSPSGVKYLNLFGGPKSRSTERVFLKPGLYVALSAFVVSSGPGLSFKSGTPTSTLSGVFHTAGSALGSTKGSAGKFVKFPGSVICSTHSAKLTWSAKAGHVKSGAFFVNGSKKGSDGHPVAGHTVTLRHLSGTADLHVSAKLALKGGGHATATRTYVPCKG